MEKVDYRCVTSVYLFHVYIFTSRICVGWFLVSLKITGGIKIRSFQWTNPSSSPNFGLKFSFYQFTGFWFIFLNSVHVFLSSIDFVYVNFIPDSMMMFFLYICFCFFWLFFLRTLQMIQMIQMYFFWLYYYIYNRMWSVNYLCFMCMFQSV